jgi:hypothetical protein
MNVLWFTNTPSLYDQGKNPYNGCGWVESLESLLKDEVDIKLGVSFIHNSDFKKNIINNTVYYPILKPTRKISPFWYILNVWSNDSIFEKKVISNMLSVIEDFKPDVIHIFGTEGLFISIQKFINIPIVVHIQGAISPCVNSYFPVDHNRLTLKYSKYFILKNLFGLGKLSDYKKLKKQAIREKNNLKITKFVMGRTNFDSRLVKLYNPDVIYFHVDEVLRPPFYIPENYRNRKKNITNKIIRIKQQKNYLNK